MQCRNVSCRACEICDEYEVIQFSVCVVICNKTTNSYLFRCICPLIVWLPVVCSVTLRPVNFSLGELRQIAREGSQHLLAHRPGDYAFDLVTYSPWQSCGTSTLSSARPSPLASCLCILHDSFSYRDVQLWSGSNIHGSVHNQMSLPVLC